MLHSDEASKTASRSAIAAVKLLILTGRRLNEVLTLRWEWIDLDTKVMRLPDTKSGRLTVSLGEAAIAVLLDLRANGRDDTFVISGQRTGASPACTTSAFLRPSRRRSATRPDPGCSPLRQ